LIIAAGNHGDGSGPGARRPGYLAGNIRITAARTWYR
jgi:hypothetical protein